MKKGIRILYFITVVISALVGLWHFFVPWMFQWYDYLPMQYENLIVGIDYTNYCFSLLLFGLSVLLIMLGKRALAMNREVIYFYFFLTVVWVFRACLASFVEPWPLQPIPVAAIGQLIASDVQAVLMLIVAIVFIVFALNHPEKSFPWNNTITWLLYGIYFLVTVVLLIAPKMKK